LQFVISLQVNKFTTEKDIIKMVRTAKRAIHLIKNRVSNTKIFKRRVE